MVPLALLPAWLAAALWTGASVGALAAVVVVVRRALGRPAPGWLVALVTGGALALEPVWQNLTFGQVNLFLMLAVLVDLLRPERRWSGVLVGIAAGVKLTPLVFVVLLVLVGRRAAAGRAALAFAGTVAVGFVAMPGSAATYWTARPARREPGRPAGVGPQPVGVRRAHPAARRPAADPAVARGRRAPLARGPGRRRRLVAPRRPGARHLPGCAWRCCSPRRSRGRTTGCGRCRSRWRCGSATGGRPPRGPRCSWPARSCGRPTASTASTGGARPTTSSATPTSWPPSPSRSGRRPPSAGGPGSHPRARRERAQAVASRTLHPPSRSLPRMRSSHS